MAIAESEPLLEPFDSCSRLFTVADLELLPTDLPSGPIDFELDNGRLVLIMVPPGDIHGAAQSNIVTELKVQRESKGYGKARTEVGVVLWRNPDRVVTPDVLFVAKKSLPIRTSAEGYLETIPELVVEIRSKNDSLKYVERKVQHYLKAGVEVVWVADPASMTVTAHTLTGEPAAYAEQDTLQLPDHIGGFSMTVADVFRV
ncbi:MAG TPA: Uma2 family endonuclease [Lacipirellulaceae bacterium]|nr:Uma2 family endonuclease [Lacipirellulaceae bacterium]